MSTIAIIIAACALSFVHLLSPALTFLDQKPRSRWLSAAAGISTAYVFVHLLPELAHLQAENFSQEEATTAEAEVFLVALFGLMVFYGLERWAKSHPAADDHTHALPARSFWIHLGAFAVYNVMIGYLLPERVRDHGLQSLAIYAFAMTLHFVVNDRGLYAHHGPRYLHQGRWVLAVAPFLGVALAGVTEISALWVSFIIAFLGGGVILNVLKEELPEERQSRFSAYALGAVFYAAILFFFL